MHPFDIFNLLFGSRDDIIGSLHVYKIQVGTAPTEQQFAIGVVFGGPCRATFPGCIFYKPFSCCNLDVILSVTLLPDILLVVNISEIPLALL
jgi:hypothetical protein